MHGIFTSESVTEGHPDKVCDFIAHSVLDAHLRRDPKARIAVEVLAKGNHVILAGEITSRARVNYPRPVRDALRAIGYTDPHLVFNVTNLDITALLTQQATEIGAAVPTLSATPSLCRCSSRRSAPATTSAPKPSSGSSTSAQPRSSRGWICCGPSTAGLPTTGTSVGRGCRGRHRAGVHPRPFCIPTP